MLEIRLSESHSKYKYRQIYESLKDMIISGKIPKDYRLPSKRELAKDLDVSVNSVATAYDQLIAEGYVYAVEKKGYYTEAINKYNPETKFPEALPESLEEDEVQKRYQYSLSHMTVNSTHFPYKKWMSFQREVINKHQFDISRLNHPQGPLEVRESIKNLISVTRGINCFPEQIVIGTGTQPLISQLIDLFEPDVKVGIENPGYSRVRDMLNDKGIHVVNIPLDNEGVDMQRMEEEDPAIQFLTPSHQFPLGMIMPISKRIDLLNWASEKEGRYLIEDDYDSEFKYGTDNIPSLQSLDKNRKVIYMGTFSKTLLPSFRISYMILPPELLEKYKARYKYWLQGNDSLQLYTLKYFIESGEYSRYVKKMNSHYENNRTILIDALRKRFGKTIDIVDVPAGLHFIAKFKTSRSYDDVKARAEAASLELYDIRRFSTGYVADDDKWKDYVLGFANLDTEEADAIAACLHTVIFE
ncbi:PLP-dependent aminotransferase family protein [Salinicoccus halitifaciens]|uniref:GntR family transcriptional regulator/MocR family aminotransferase n=1 Tax=Salinicoccus halitifaciens TaxID=1073415 RepID=A0ABV2E8J5_9STAP|nr:PLP-dependent aminotransferase family protein [Salinicoccus halitifaciens]MCD2137871.1 PLP-dependent aminotransferase family protein [Salinicoccus halitifaciens]